LLPTEKGKSTKLPNDVVNINVNNLVSSLKDTDLTVNPLELLVGTRYGVLL